MPSNTYEEYADDEDQERSDRSFERYVEVLQRRWLSIAITAFSVFLLGVVIAFAIPPAYRSIATILIQEQEIPQDLVRSTITSYADERIQVISQQVLARSVLIGLIEKYNLYARRRLSETNEEILDRMRADIQLKTVSADVIDRRSGNQVKATIAFKLSYDSNTPENAQKIDNELVSLYLNENTKDRQQRAAETSNFLGEESARIASHIAEVETQLAAFKSKNEGRLPELRELNFNLSERTDSELARVERDIAQVTDRRAAAQAQLALTSPNAALPAEGGAGVVLQPQDRLKALKAELAADVGIYSSDHPDVKRLRREIAALQAQGFDDGVNDGQDERKLQALRAQLVESQQKYGDGHPDVVKLKREVAALENLPTEGTPRGAQTRVRAENPVYLTLRSQIDDTNAQLRALETERHDLKAKQRDLETKLEQTPEVERAYLSLSRDQENSRARFREIKQKQMEAEVAEQLEHDRKAERFTLIDPPQLPEKPASPNRPVIVLAGFVLALVAGGLAAAARETLDGTIKDPLELSRYLGAPVLSVIPMVEPLVDQARRLRVRWLGAGGVVGGILLILLITHLALVPLDVVWYAITRRVFG